MTVHHAEHGEPAVIGRLLDTHVVLRVERVDDCRRRSIATRVKLERTVAADVADEQSAHLLGFASASMSDDLLLDVVGDHETPRFHHDDAT